MTTETITVASDGEVFEDAAPITLFGTTDPVQVVDRASTIATALADVIKTRNLYKRIGQSDHVFVEGWTLLGSMLGVFAEVEWSRPLEENRGWESRAVARTLAGRTVGAAESMCSRSESKWRSADDYAIRSMAQTRAVSKALRLPLGFIMELAGYSATPAEELTETARSSRRPADPDGREAPVAVAAPQSAEAGAVVSAAAPAPLTVDEVTDEVLRERYTWAERLGWVPDALDDVAVSETGETPMTMGNAAWTEFATRLKVGRLDPPPKPGTDGYKKLVAVDKAAARAYWQKEEATA